ncbi:hypothetical protein ZIOFF_018099 [Zingiber officinale]|uniref:Uncharacterized protein n=1 Tax=Zingiber officinale TaxID=94328 RepID=A0A8J5HG10_ZINOF|nr:hypothetical protein ZIOFF_018099 [Zingiber officinale]
MRVRPDNLLRQQSPWTRERPTTSLAMCPTKWCGGRYMGHCLDIPTLAVAALPLPWPPTTSLPFAASTLHWPRWLLFGSLPRNSAMVVAASSNPAFGSRCTSLAVDKFWRVKQEPDGALEMSKRGTKDIGSNKGI